MINKVIGIEVECECGTKHTIPFDDLDKYYSRGCDSCSFGESTEYSWACPTLKRRVSYTDDN